MSAESSFLGSRRGLLNSLHARHSSDDKTSSSSDLDLDELDSVDKRPGTQLRGGWGWKRGKKNHRISSIERRAARDEADTAKSKRRDGCLRNKTCGIIAAILVSALLMLLASVAWLFKKHAPVDGKSPPWYPTPKGGAVQSWNESYQKAYAMVSRMSLVEKVNITTGTGFGTNLCVGNTGPAVDAGFPMLCLQDGPLGIRFVDNATLWPAGITAAATWNKDLIYQRGKGLGREHRLKGVNVMLGPSMGPMGRSPLGGRNWEGFGPDPVLAGAAAAYTIKGVQEEGVMATAKHFIGNEQEHFRQAREWGIPNAISSNIGDRTLHELYLWPFADSVRAGVASVMCSYNMVNNSYACGNSKLMNGILKDELGFQGFVQSDWLAQRSGVASALAGLDMSMPGDGLAWNDRSPLWGSKLTEAALNESVPMNRLNDMVTRVVASWYQLKQDNKTLWPPHPPKGKGGPNFSSFTKAKTGRIHSDTDDKTTAVVNRFVNVQGAGNDSHADLAREVAAEGTILVKNNDAVLPLDLAALSSTPAGKTYRIGIYGEDAGPNPNGLNACADQACNIGTLAVGWGSGAAEFPFLKTPVDVLQAAFQNHSIETTAVLTNKLPKSAVDQIKEQDLCLVFINSDSGEGFVSWEHITDRKDLYPQKGGDELVKQVARHCNRTIVTVHAVGPVVLEKWINDTSVKAVLLASLPGEESGNALADVMLGVIDASGRLPYTIGKSLDDYGSGAKILTRLNGLDPQQDFDDGLLIDYRHFDAQNITPRYEFGFGLSYTTFSFSNLALKTLKPRSPQPSPRSPDAVEPPSYPTAVPDASEAVWPQGFRRIGRYIYPYLANASVSVAPYPYPTGYFISQPPSPAGGGEGGNPSLYDEHLSVSVQITNTGNRRGKQVVQIYIGFPQTVDATTGQSVDFPPQVLRAFEKVELEKGGSEIIEFNLTRRDLSYWSVGAGNWVMPDGEFRIHAGASSRDLPLSEVWT